MARYSRGKHSFLIDDKSGFKIRYRDAVTQWDGIRTHALEADERHPQEDPRRNKRKIVDPQRLRKPRPDTDDDGGVDEQLSETLSSAGRPATFGAI